MYFRVLMFPFALALSTALYAKQTHPIPFKAESSVSSTLSWPLSLSLLIIILGLVVYWSTRRQPTSLKHSQLVLLAQKRISTKTWSSLLQIEDHRFLVVDNGHCIEIQPLPLQSHEE